MSSGDVVKTVFKIDVAYNYTVSDIESLQRVGAHQVRRHSFDAGRCWLTNTSAVCAQSEDNLQKHPG